MEISSTLLGLIKCPITGDSLVYDRENQLLISKKAGVAYPIIEGIPLLLISEAKKIIEPKTSQKETEAAKAELEKAS